MLKKVPDEVWNVFDLLWLDELVEFQELAKEVLPEDCAEGVSE